MKVVVKDKNKSFFDECMFIQIYIRNLLKRPKRRVWSARKYFLCWSAVCFAMVLYILSRGISVGFQSFEYFFLVFFAFYGGVLVYNYFFVKKSLNNYMNSEDSDSVFEITKDSVTLEKDSQTLELKWDSIKYVIINRETISFLPKEVSVTGIVMFISTKYKEDVLNALKKYKKEDLLIDNSKLYK